MPVYLYPRQREIYDYIKQYIQKVGTSPTLKQIAEAMDLSSLATVSEHLDALEKKGLIERLFGEARGIRILEETNAILLFGNEVDGITPEGMSTATEIVEIPRIGTHSSLNVATACGIVISELVNRN